MNFGQTDLVFRFVGGQNDGSLVPVKTEKCFLGGNNEDDPKCAVLRGPAGAAIRSLGTEVLVNGKQVESDWLQEGDQIKVGSACLEVLQLGHFETVTETSTSDLPTPLNEPEGTSQPLNELERPLTTTTGSTTDGTVSNSNDFAVESADPGNATHQVSESAPARSEMSVNSENSEVNPNPDLPNSDVPPTPGDFANRANELEAAIEQNQEFLKQMMQESMADRPSENTNDGQATAEIEPSRDPNWGDRQQVQKDPTRQPDDDDKQMQGEALAERLLNSGPESTPEPEPQSSFSMLANDDDEERIFAPSLGDKEDPVEEESSAPKAESVAEVLARMQAAGTVEPDFEQGIGEVGEPDNEEPPVQSMPEPPAPQLQTNENGDVDVEDYMSQLFQRLRGDSSPTSMTPSSPAVHSQTESAGSDSPVKTPLQATSVQHIELLKASEYKPKSVAPEKKSNMAAMRELALESTREALNKSRDRDRKQKATVSLYGAFGGLFLSTILMIFAGSINLYFFLGTLGLVVSLGIAGFSGKVLMDQQKAEKARKAKELQAEGLLED